MYKTLAFNAKVFLFLDKYIDLLKKILHQAYTVRSRNGDISDMVTVGCILSFNFIVLSTSYKLLFIKFMLINIQK